MPIRVVTKEERYIYELSLTLEHSMPISSPAAAGLTLGADRLSFKLCVNQKHPCRLTLSLFYLLKSIMVDGIVASLSQQDQ